MTATMATPTIEKSTPVETLVELLKSPERRAWPSGWQEWPNFREAHRQLAREFLADVPAMPAGPGGRGIVCCAGGEKYFPSAWVLLKMLRRLECRLPVQFWHFPGEVDLEMRRATEPLGATWVDGRPVEARESILRRPIRGGWELKAFALAHCGLDEAILLDADNVPLRDPEKLLDTPQYREKGAILWPDYGRLGHDRAAWEAFDVPFRDEPEVESGQLVVDRRRCWPALALAAHYNDYSDFYYRFVHGDKETFHLGFRRAGVDYAMPPYNVRSIGGVTMAQQDFHGETIFQHRNLCKWRYDGSNPHVDGFLHESTCRVFLGELRTKWSGILFGGSPEDGGLVGGKTFDYHRVGFDRRPLELCVGGKVGQGAATCERRWAITVHREGAVDVTSLVIFGEGGVTCTLRRVDDGVWRGQWDHHERMPIELTELAETGVI